MAVNITNDAANWSAYTLRGGRLVTRTSAGIPYCVFTSWPTYSPHIFKGNSATPTSFAVQDDGNAPAASSNFPACAIDGSDVIHIIYNVPNGKDSEVRYVTYTTSTDLWGTPVVLDDTGESSIDQEGMGIAIDASGVPHVCYQQYNKSKGTEYATLWYKNKVGGSWNTSVEVEGASATKNVRHSDICIDDSGYPFISYINLTDTTMTQATSASNNPSSFTLTDRDATASLSTTSSAVKSDGVKVTLYLDSDLKLAIYDGATQRILSGSGVLNDPRGVACVGTDIYVFYTNATAVDVCYDVWDGSSWLGETVLETGTYFAAFAKWSWEFNYGANGTNYNDSSASQLELDYVFATGGDDWFFGTLTLAAPPGPIPDRLVMARQAVKVASEW